MKKFSILCVLCCVFSTLAYTDGDVATANTLANQGIIVKQTTASKYRLDYTILRQEVIKMALAVKGVEVPADYTCKKYFADVIKNDWVCGVIETAADNGIITRSNRYANPGKDISRSEALKMIMTAGNVDRSPSAGHSYYYDGNLFEDGSSLGYKDAYTFGAQWQASLFYDYIRFVLEDDTLLKQNPRASELAKRSEVFWFVKNIQTGNIINNPIDAPFFLQGWDGEYSLIHQNDVGTTKFIPDGYEIVDQREYEVLPDFLILKKDKDLFSYDIRSGGLRKILTTNQAIQNDEYVRISPSVTEKNKFFITVLKFDPLEEPGMGGPTTISTRSYLFDASTHTYTDQDSPDYAGCSEFDSKNNRFFVWPCGEGIGTSLPLYTMNIDGGGLKEIVSLGEFGLTKDDVGVVAVYYRNGLFFALSKGGINKIVTINPSHATPQKQTYTLTDAIQAQLLSQDTYPYSAAYNPTTDTFILGGQSSIILLRASNRVINEIKIIPEKELYANFLFLYNDNLYYQSPEFQGIRKVNLKTWNIEKTSPAKLSEPVTLILFPNY